MPRLALVALHDDRADRSVFARERDPEPIDRRRTDQLDLAAVAKLRDQVARGEQRPAGAQDILGEAAAQRRGLRWRLESVDEVGEAQEVARAIVERDVEILGRHQAAHHLVNRAAELGELADPLGCDGYAVGGVADDLAAVAPRDVAETPDPTVGTTVDQPWARRPLQNPAILEVEEVVAGGLGLRIELADLGEKVLGIGKLVEHEGERPFVVAGRRESPAAGATAPRSAG